MNKLNIEAEVFASDRYPDEWCVQTIEAGEGRIVDAIFSGPDAEARAMEYAAAKYQRFRRHAPDPPRYRSHQAGVGGHSGPSPTRGANLRLVK